MSEQHERTSLGAYALGQVDAAEAARIEAHLAGCARCRADLDEVAPAAAALSRVRPAVAGRRGTDEVPPGLGARIESAVERDRRRADRRRWTRGAGIAGIAAAAAAAVVVGGVALLGDDGTPTPTARIPIEAVPVQVEEPGITADADIVAHTWGVEVKLTATGFDRGDRYRVAVVGTDGVRHPAGEFVGTGPKPMLCNLNSSVLRDRADGFEVTDSGGSVVVVSRFAR